MSVPGAFFQVTGADRELIRICAAIDRNDGRLTASSSASLDLWQDMLEEWFRIHDRQVAAEALRDVCSRLESTSFVSSAVVDVSSSWEAYNLVTERLRAEADRIEAGK